MAEDRWGPGHLARATAVLTGAARDRRDRRLQQALLELAGACDAFDRAPTRSAADAARLAARARALAGTADLVGAGEVAAAAQAVVDALAAPPEAPPAPDSSPERPVPGATKPLARPPNGNGQSPLILVIDDDPDVRRLFLFRLRAAGYRISLAEDGEQGVAKARAEQPALIICDLGMPLVPGELLILALRMDPTTAQIPIAVVTGDPARLGPEHQVDVVLPKPVEFTDLLATVRRLVAANPGAQR